MQLVSRQSFSRAIVALTSVATFSACSSGSAVPPSTFAQTDSVASRSAPAFLDAVAKATSATHVFVSNGDAVLIYTEQGQKLGQIGGLSEAGPLATDTLENLYVVNGTSIDIFKKPYNKKPIVLNGSGNGVSVANSGLVAVSTIISQSGGPGSIAFYKKGALSPCNALRGFGRTYFSAFDAAGDLFVDGSDSNGKFVIGEIAGGCSAKSVAILTIGNTIEFPGDIAVDTNGHIAIGDQEAGAIYTYAPPKHGSLGNPLKTTSYSASDLVSFVFSNGGHDIWGIDAGLAQASEFAYPSGGSPIMALDSGGGPDGIAVTPVVAP